MARRGLRDTSDSLPVPAPGPSALVKDADPPLQGLALVEKAIAVSEAWAGRPRDFEGRPGGLIEFPSGLRPVIIGDLHANLKHLEAIIDHDGNRGDLEAGRAALIFVGDSVHDDRTGHMREMESSVAILQRILRLILEYPKGVYYIRGNHDTFDERLRKSGIAQGLEFRNALLAAEGPDYLQAVQRFFDSLPVFVIGEGFVVAHAGPPRGGLVREELVDIRRYPEKYHQLMWNRVNEFHGNPSPKEYGEKDLRLVIELLDLPPETAFIVGHNPLWSDGNRTGVWLDVIGMKNHHIIYSGSGSRAPYFTKEGGKLVVKLAAKDEPEVYNYG